MWKPFFAALAIGFVAVWLFRKKQTSDRLDAVTYHDKDGNITFAGPDVDPLTGAYTGPGAGSGTIGATSPN